MILFFFTTWKVYLVRVWFCLLLGLFFQFWKDKVANRPLSVLLLLVTSRPFSLLQEKFKDVVNWLKQSKGRGDNVSPESTGAEKKQVGEVENNYVKPASNNSLFASNTQPGIFSTNQSSNFSSSPFGLASNSQTGSFSSGQFGLAKSNSQPSFSFSNNQNPFSSGGI